MPVIPPPTYATTAFSPSSGAIGSSVTINGSNFTEAPSVKIGNVAASFTMVSATQISAVIPSGATSSTVTVVTSGGSATSSATLTVIPPPTITSFSPMSTHTGTQITVTGTNFTNVQSVTIGDTPPESYNVVSATMMSPAL